MRWRKPGARVPPKPAWVKTAKSVASAALIGAATGAVAGGVISAREQLAVSRAEAQMREVGFKSLEKGMQIDLRTLVFKKFVRNLAKDQAAKIADLEKKTREKISAECELFGEDPKHLRILLTNANDRELQLLANHPNIIAWPPKLRERVGGILTRSQEEVNRQFRIVDAKLRRHYIEQGAESEKELEYRRNFGNETRDEQVKRNIGRWGWMGAFLGSVFGAGRLGFLGMRRRRAEAKRKKIEAQSIPKPAAQSAVVPKRPAQTTLAPSETSQIARTPLAGGERVKRPVVAPLKLPERVREVAAQFGRELTERQVAAISSELFRAGTGSESSDVLAAIMHEMQPKKPEPEQRQALPDPEQKRRELLAERGVAGLSIPSMKTKEFMHVLSRLGCENLGRSGTDHITFRNPSTGRRSMFSYHGTDLEMGPTRIHSILKQLEIDEGEFLLVVHNRNGRGGEKKT